MIAEAGYRMSDDDFLDELRDCLNAPGATPYMPNGSKGVDRVATLALPCYAEMSETLRAALLERA